MSSLHLPNHHCRECCRYCWEWSQIDVNDLIVMPPRELWLNCPTVRDYIRLSLTIPDREFALGHERDRIVYGG